MRSARLARLVVALLGAATCMLPPARSVLPPDVRAVLLGPRHRLPFGPPSASEYLGQIALERGAERLLHHPLLEEQLAGMSEHERDQTMQRLAGDGIPRLADELVVQRALLLRDALLLADDATCAAAWRGATPEEAAHLVLKLPPPSLERWSEIAVKSAEALLREDPPHALDVNDVQAALDALVMRVAARDAASGRRLQSALENPDPTSATDACWAARALYGALGELPPDQQPQTARALTTP